MSDSQAPMHSHQATHDKVKAQFGKVASRYVNSPIHAKGEELNSMLALAGEVRDKAVLDVATGSGHTALHFAKAGAAVSACDLTPMMLEVAQAFIGQSLPEPRHPLSYKVSSAEQLVFDNATFDIVTCRIAAHHFADVPAFVAEVRRVLKPGGLFLLVDNIAPTPRPLADVMNHIERLRDKSHVEAYSIAQWSRWLDEQELDLLHLSRMTRRKNYASWMARADADETTIKTVESYVLGLPEGYQDYFHVEMLENKLHQLSHEAALLASRKPMV